jgi:hypothetical protein
VAQWTQEHPHFEEATYFLKRNVSLALLLTLVPVLLFLAQNAPRLIISTVALMLLIPLLRLLPPFVHPAARPVLYLCAGFHILDSLRNLFLTIPLLDRLSFVVLDSVAILIVVWLFRAARIKRIQAEKAPPHYLIVASRIVLLLLIASLVANIVGYFDLARVLSTGTLYSIYAAFALFGTAGALSVLFSVLLDTDWARSLSIVRHYDKTMSWWTFRLLRFAAFAFWLNSVLNFFTIKESVVKAVVAFFTAPIKEGRINFSLWDGNRDCARGAPHLGRRCISEDTCGAGRAGDGQHGGVLHALAFRLFLRPGHGGSGHQQVYAVGRCFRRRRGFRDAKYRQ